MLVSPSFHHHHPISRHPWRWPRGARAPLACLGHTLLYTRVLRHTRAFSTYVVYTRALSAHVLTALHVSPSTHPHAHYRHPLHHRRLPVPLHQSLPTVDPPPPLAGLQRDTLVHTHTHTIGSHSSGHLHTFITPPPLRTKTAPDTRTVPPTQPPPRQTSHTLVCQSTARVFSTMGDWQTSCLACLSSAPASAAPNG